MSTLVALAAALLSAVLNGVGTVAQALAAQRAGGHRILAQPAYLVGWALDLVGWVLSVIALRHLPLIVVQPLLATSLAFAVVLMVPLLHVHVGKVASLSVAVVVLSVAVLAVSAEPGRAASPPWWLRPALAVAAVLLAVAWWVSRTAARPVLTACLSGLCWSVSALSARGMHGTGGWEQLPTEPLAWLTALTAFLGALTFARAVEVAGEHGVATVTAWLWLVQVVVPSLVGVVVLGDSLRPGWTLPALVALGTASLASVTLSRSSTRAATTPA